MGHEGAGERSRIESIDWLRGAVIALMALDHVRDFIAPGPLPEDIPDVGLGLFATRWVTHFCAPVFVVLAGVSAGLLGEKIGRPALTRFLLTRGLWLILIELTVVNASWQLHPLPFSSVIILQVIWAIGASMVLLAVALWLPRRLVGALSLLVIFGHNLLDRVPLDVAIRTDGLDGGAVDFLWALLHARGGAPLPFGPYLAVAYPLVPWVAVLSLGWAVGPWLFRDAELRVRRLLTCGLATTLGFFVLRAVGVYGGPREWSFEDGLVSGLISFLNCEKYPPSLNFLLMTLGPACLVLAWLESRGLPRGGRWLLTLGRVPFFFYLLHLPLAGYLAAAWFHVVHDDPGRWVQPLWKSPPEGWEPSLLVVYVAWLVVLALLWPACRWFEGVKRRHRVWWIRYL